MGHEKLHLTVDSGVEKTINFHHFDFGNLLGDDAGRQYHKMQHLDWFNQVVLIDRHLTWPRPVVLRWDFNPAMLYTWEGDSWKDWLIRR